MPYAAYENSPTNQMFKEYILEIQKLTSTYIQSNEALATGYLKDFKALYVYLDATLLPHFSEGKDIPWYKQPGIMKDLNTLKNNLEGWKKQLDTSLKRNPNNPSLELFRYDLACLRENILRKHLLCPSSEIPLDLASFAPFLKKKSLPFYITTFFPSYFESDDTFRQSIELELTHQSDIIRAYRTKYPAVPPIPQLLSLLPPSPSATSTASSPADGVSSEIQTILDVPQEPSVPLMRRASPLLPSPSNLEIPVPPELSRTSDTSERDGLLLQPQTLSDQLSEIMASLERIHLEQETLQTEASLSHETETASLSRYAELQQLIETNRLKGVERQNGEAEMADLKLANTAAQSEIDTCRGDITKNKESLRSLEQTLSKNTSAIAQNNKMAGGYDELMRMLQKNKPDIPFKLIDKLPFVLALPFPADKGFSKLLVHLSITNHKDWLDYRETRESKSSFKPESRVIQDYYDALWSAIETQSKKMSEQNKILTEQNTILTENKRPHLQQILLTTQKRLEEKTREIQTVTQKQEALAQKRASLSSEISSVEIESITNEASTLFNSLAPCRARHDQMQANARQMLCLEHQLSSLLIEIEASMDVQLMYGRAVLQSEEARDRLIFPELFQKTEPAFLRAKLVNSLLTKLNAITEISNDVQRAIQEGLSKYKTDKKDTSVLLTLLVAQEDGSPTTKEGLADIYHAIQLDRMSVKPKRDKSDRLLPVLFRLSTLHLPYVTAIDDVYERLNQMKAYGKHLSRFRSREQDGVHVMECERKLRIELDFFVLQHQDSPPSEEQYTAFKSSFGDKIHGFKGTMHNHDAEWKQLIANILLALSAVLTLSGSYFYRVRRTEKATGRGTFFYSQTERENKMDLIDHALNAVTL